MSETTAVASTTSLDDSRLLARLEELATIGAQPSGGVTRLAYSPDDVTARELAARWMAEAGLEVDLDTACNLIGRSPGSQPGLSPIVLGSHLDTVRDGGRYDGAYGVVAAIEVAAALVADGPTRHPLTVVAFANEEGAGGAKSFDGSRAIVGAPNPLDGVDRSGVSLADRIDGAGGSSTKLASSAWNHNIAAFFELHIEQGPVLDDESIPIGVVTGITGLTMVDIDIVGRANHAGTTPMELRCDALNVAARAILTIEDLPATSGVRVATTGIIDVHPNVRNVVPGRVTLGAELRDLDPALMERAVEQLQASLADLAGRTGATITTTVSGGQAPVPADPDLMNLISTAAASCGAESKSMVSGAGHDAQVMADLGPIGMVFVPSRHGISHSPKEHTEPSDLVTGAQVLLAATIAADRR
jgi:N-carbamoyl-L-amino-acid hydrolase